MSYLRTRVFETSIRLGHAAADAAKQAHLTSQVDTMMKFIGCPRTTVPSGMEGQ